MSNNLKTAQLIAKQVAVALENTLGIAGRVHRDHEREFGPGKTGDTVLIRAPVEYQVQDGPSITTQTIVDRNIPMTVDKSKVVAREMSQADLALKEDEMAERISVPAARSLANIVEADVLATAALGFHNTTGAWTSTAPTIKDFRAISAANTRLTEAGVPMDGRFAITSPADYDAITSDVARNVRHDASAGDAMRNGNIVRINGLDVAQSNLLRRQQTGARAPSGITITSPAVGVYDDNYRQTVTLAQTASGVASWLRAGEVISFAGVFDVDPVLKIPTGRLKQFVVMQDATLATNAASVVISPPMITTGPYRTVSNLPTDGATVTVNGNANLFTTEALVMHKNAIALAMVPIAVPAGAGYSARASYKGISVTVTGDFDFSNFKSLMRFDVLYGTKLIRPELVVRTAGTV
jgi:hypothetical protein